MIRFSSVGHAIEILAGESGNASPFAMMRFSSEASILISQHLWS